MRRRVHPVRPARDDDLQPSLREPGPEARPDPHPVVRAGPRAHHGHRAQQRPHPQAGPAPHPQTDRPRVPQVVQLTRPLGVPGHTNRAPSSATRAKSALRGRRFTGPGDQSCPALRPHPRQRPCARHRHHRHGHHRRAGRTGHTDRGPSRPPPAASPIRRTVSTAPELPQPPPDHLRAPGSADPGQLAPGRAAPRPGRPPRQLEPAPIVIGTPARDPRSQLQRASVHVWAKGRSGPRGRRRSTPPEAPGRARERSGSRAPGPVRPRPGLPARRHLARSACPGTSLLVRHGVSANRAAARSRALPALRSATTCVLSPRGPYPAQFAARDGVHLDPEVHPSRSAARRAGPAPPHGGRWTRRTPRPGRGTARRAHGFAASAIRNRAQPHSLRSRDHHVPRLQGLAQCVQGPAVRVNSGASSRKSTPRCDSETAPGLATPGPPRRGTAWSPSGAVRSTARCRSSPCRAAACPPPSGSP